MSTAGVSDALVPPGNYVLVMGISRADKDAFVESVTGKEASRHKSSETSQSTRIDLGQTATVEVVPPFQERQFLYVLLLAFGADASEDVKDIERLVDWLVAIHKKHVILTGIIYLQPISDDGLGNASHRFCNIFQRIVGKEVCPSVVLTASMWNKTDTATGERRLGDLKESLWASMIENGAHRARFHGDKKSLSEILAKLPKDGHAVTLAVQREMVGDEKDLNNTGVGLYHDQDLDNMTRKRYERLLEGLLREYWLATERPDEALSNELRTHLAGVRASLQKSPTSRPADSNGSIYTALQPGQIRLVELRAGEADTPVEVSFSVLNLEDRPQYEALSHVVGKGNSINLVRVRSGHRVGKQEVSQALEHILKILRLSDMDRSLWVDELSIDQKNSEERSAQVRMMSQIFRAAQSVCIWLGPEKDKSDLAMGFIPKVLGFDSLDKHVQDKTKTEEWTALARLLGRDWFTRRWVVQEMALAKQATVHCGTKVVPWSDLVVAAELFGSKWVDIQRILGQDDADKLGDAPPPGAASLVDISSNIFRKDGHGAIQERLFSIESLLARLPMFNVTDDRDAFYAVMNLANDTYNKSDVPVDYDLQPAKLFRAVHEIAVKSSDSLDILCRPWAPSCFVPSWIRTVSDYAYVRRDDGQYDRHNADSLVGLPGQRRYRAAGTSAYHIRYDGLLLSVRGIKIRSITSIGGECMNGNIPENWMTYGGWPKRVGDSPQSLWRTLVADRAPDGSNPPSWYGKAFEYSFRKSPSEDVDTNKLIIRCHDSTSVQEFLRRVRATTWKRRFLLMKPINEHGTLHEGPGLGPAHTHFGDIVCILYGCSVPMVLRPEKNPHGEIEKDKDGNPKHYQLIGECFVYGMMEGQAMKGLHSGRYKETNFNIK